MENVIPYRTPDERTFPDTVFYLITAYRTPDERTVLDTVFYLITAHTPKSAQSSDSVVFRL